jgi:hypothetical protein
MSRVGPRVGPRGMLRAAGGPVSKSPQVRARLRRPRTARRRYGFLFDVAVDELDEVE